MIRDLIGDWCKQNQSRSDLVAALYGQHFFCRSEVSDGEGDSCYDPAYRISEHEPVKSHVAGKYGVDPEDPHAADAYH